MDSVSGSSARFRMGAVLLVVLAVCLFVPGLHGGFLFDDVPNIVKNTSIHITQWNMDDLLYAAYSFQPGKGSRSLAMLSFALDHWRGGLDARAFKITNLLIHALTMCVLALFFRQLLAMARWPIHKATMCALVLALLWAIHPLQVSSVLYVVQRMQTLVTLFVVLALWAYLCMRQAQMEGRRSRQYGALAILFGVLGFASKEDAALLPAYMLALELTVLRFRAARPELAKVLRNGYLVVALAGLVIYLVLVVPHYWHWDAYRSRDFSSYERLLTQGRVLVMYLGQIMLPLPRLLPFYYDNLAISRGWLQPLTTLPAWLMVVGMLAWAWRWRSRRPLFSLGVLLFFAGHFMTSNVINLELAFEHRNHFPLVGAILAVADLCMMAWQRWSIRTSLAAVPIALIVVALGTGTAWRAHIWGDPLRFAEYGVAVSPHSERAWLRLNGVYTERSELKADSPWLDKAIEVSERGVEMTGSVPLLSNLVVYKTIKGTVGDEDWDRLLSRLRQVPASAQNRNILWVLLNNTRRGVPLDEKRVLQVIEEISSRATFAPSRYLEIGAYIHNDTHSPGKALPYLRRAVELSPPGDPAITKLLAELAAADRKDWVKRLMDAQERAGHHNQERSIP
ncbi:glycosyltransferase family 39 protein [Stenotrophomonas sp. NLF4-10]|uniref:glycosyltransferase family 39 protein n=1 Tax=Stenotrophomonas sp. NLF4-10 TaxID=2918754 RepID=UPI001EFBE7C7|nr:glycosyltransferase family 39 protein [Stenotrophomonas sp. NLF4-10]MCG8277396.1 glycosyltransferase family 39 protein [Stenotrophomonas sp. NLF4-10]